MVRPFVFLRRLGGGITLACAIIGAMSIATKALAGLGVGVILAGVTFGLGRWRSGSSASAQCPTGWLPDSASTMGEGKLLVACTSRAEGMDNARIELRWSDTGALSPPGMEILARSKGFSSPQELRAQREEAAGLEGAAMVREHQGVALKSDVYFLSAGQRYGMLSIVYGPTATFIQEDTVAAWMETVQGTATWGAPVSPDLHASCPQGFTTLRAVTPGLVVRCMKNVGSTAFTVLQMIQSNGGFGSEEDRARLAGDIAQRVASGGGGRARVLVQPTPFTRARNVDAMRASFETEEHLTLNTRVSWLRTGDSGNVFAQYVGPDNDEGPAAAASMIRAVKASRVNSLTLAMVSVALAALCSVIGALLGRRDANKRVSDGPSAPA